MKNRETTVLINSHNLSELEKICDYYGFINNGSIISQGTLEQLQKAYGKNSDSNIELEDIDKEIFNVRQF